MKQVEQIVLSFEDIYVMFVSPPEETFDTVMKGLPPISASCRFGNIVPASTFKHPKGLPPEHCTLQVLLDRDHFSDHFENVEVLLRQFLQNHPLNMAYVLELLVFDILLQSPEQLP